jgi:hypothetical protein
MTLNLAGTFSNRNNVNTSSSNLALSLSNKDPEGMTLSKINNSTVKS